ncbi:MAG: ABC transporter substrate-binding protein [bacterium]|nr:ABC transporter substrate-binding protein [bacterium]
MKHAWRFSSLMLMWLALAANPALADQGVSDDEVVIGSVSDLSGPFSAFGAPAVAAAQRHFDAVNAAGGIHGRTIRFVVEDHAYQMPKAIQAYNKLVNRDGVFAMVLSLGTPMNIAGFKLMEPGNIPNLLPLSASRHMLDEPIRLRFSVSSSYYEQMRLATAYLARTLGITRVCGMYIPSDFGKEMQEAAIDEAEVNPALAYVTETSHKIDEADFVGSLQKLAAEGCELIGVALSVRQVITVMATAKKLGLSHLKMIGTSGSFHTVIAKVPGGVTEGLYATGAWTDLAARADQEAAAAFIAAHMEATGEFPGTGALLGHIGATSLTRALEKAGRDLDVESFLAAVESLDYYDPLMDNHVTYTADDHQGADVTILSVIEDGNWKEVARLQ